jgi:hypothetical protein
MSDVSPEEAYKGLDDEELMQRLFYRDLNAFRALYDRYGNLAYSTALRVVRDPQIAEDMVQEIFLRLWRKPESYVAQRGRFATWLTSVSRNRAVDEVRSRGRRYRHETASPEEQEREVAGPERDDPAMTAPLDELLPVTEPVATAWIIGAGVRGPDVPPPLASFTLELGQAGDAAPVPLPAWLPAHWAAISSARSLLALGLLEAAPGTVLHLTLGRQRMALCRTEAAA